MSTDIERHMSALGVATTQTAAVEQARAVAEVQAAVTVAQAIPRDLNRAHAEMRQSCSTLATAEIAFYRVPKRGEGPSVHLARELARIWGNIDYGVRELRRDDELGVSEIQAFAWDQQTNVRSTRTFQVPHQRMAGGKRSNLTDLGDVYLNNQNVGARAVRECIFTVLPRSFTAEAMTLCEQTLARGDGEPLDARITKAISGFRSIGVTPEQIEDKLGKRQGQWDAGDVGRLGVLFTSIKQGETTVDDEFPPTAVTVAELAGGAK